MKLVKRTILLYQSGSSDKVYEVDLCQISQDRYVVNFRYGRRGTNLKEGTKTVQAVPEAEALRVFEQLVNSKLQKGYRDASVSAGSNATEDTSEKSGVVSTKNPRHQAILNCIANRGSSKWQLERAIWRAGELKISEATPLLIQLIGTGDRLRDYCIAWALGWCEDKSAISSLERLYNNASNPEFVRRIAFEALLKLSNEVTREKLRSERINQLPLELHKLAQQGTAAAFSAALSTYLNSTDYTRFAVLDTIYQVDNEYVRPALLDILRTAPLKPNYFQRIRHIFKTAEYRLDTEVFSILTYRFEQNQANFSSDKYYVQLPGGGYLRKSVYGSYNPQTGRYDITNEVAAELQHPNSRIAYSSKTREYLRRRVWRTLKTLGEESDLNYVNLAVAILLQYSDADAQAVKESIFYRWDRSSWRSIQYKRNWDTYASYLTFNHILYSNSPRYVLKPNSKAWRCQESYKPGDPEPAVREEAFPRLWEQNSAALLRLLLESNCRLVHHFAVKALRVCEQFCAELDVDIIIQLVNKPYELTAQLGFELARDRYNPSALNRELILALANCLFQPARTQAHRWIEEQREYFLTDSNFIAALVTSQHADTRIFARRLLSSSILNDSTARILIGRIIAELLSFTADTSTDLAREIGETLLVSFTPQLRTLGLGVVLDLLRHPMPEIQALGARILLNHDIKAPDLPAGLIDSLINSPDESVRGIGVRLFGQLSDETLLQRYDLLSAMATHELADMRNAIRPIIRRLSTQHRDFSFRLATELINLLMIPEKHEGVHSYLVRLLRELQTAMSSFTKQTALQLLKAKSRAAQELGGSLLSANHTIWAAEFETGEIVKLANHEILSVREAAQEICWQNLNRIRTNSQEMLIAVRLLESKWDDSREFGLRIFSTVFTEVDFTPDVLIFICDSVREDVRQFGRDLVTRYFIQSNGQEYLLKFSEHPSADMQLFATNYLETYAVDNPDRLRELQPYFVSVLSRVNRGTVAKQRIFAFLDAEAQKSETAASIVAEILTRQSLTVAIADKAKAIQTMLKIHKTYPHLSLPIQLKPVTAVRN